MHLITQADGGEQGDPLMPALFSLGIHGALEATKAELLQGEDLYAYLDDIYVVCQPQRCRIVFDTLRHHLSEKAGIEINLGKCKVWNASGNEPPGIRQLGDDVWKGGVDTPIQMRGLMVLGSPLGSDEYVKEEGAKRNRKEREFLDLVVRVPDLQCA
jgi:hypothetical protein